MKEKYEKLPKEIMSEYLSRGFSKEELNIKDVNINLEDKLATALIDVSTNFKNSYKNEKDNIYHWSAITAYRAVSQLIISYICTEKNKSKRELGEVEQISSTMNTKKPIRNIKNVPIKIDFSKYLNREKGLWGEVLFDVNNKSFYGDIRFFVKCQ